MMLDDSNLQQFLEDVNTSSLETRVGETLVKNVCNILRLAN
jgi:hypothetical protein